MIKQAFILLTVVTVCLAMGDGRMYSKKNTFQAPSSYASVASFHAAKQAQPQSQAQSQQAPSPYAFSYDAEGSARQESSDASGKVSGSYKVTNEDGSVRVVNYVADENGFRADVDTDEPGTKSDNPADVSFKSAAVEKRYEAPAKFATQSYAQKTTKMQYAQKPVQFNMGSNSGVSYHHQSRQQPIQQSQFSDSRPSPYAFSYDAQLDDGSSSRSETADASGKVVGSYSLSAADGRKRIIKYEADQEGFRAVVDTNEFGTKSDSPADVEFQSSAPREAPVSRMYAASGHKTAPAAAFPFQQNKLTSGSRVKSTFQAPVMYQGQPSVQYSSPVEEKPSPYSFNYDAELDDGSSSRSESADGTGKVIGSYKLSVADGRQRTVDYLADKDGFRATVNTNEFGTKSDSPADVQFYSSATFDEPAPYSSPNAYKASSSSASMYSSPAIQQQPIQSPIHFSMGDGNGAYSYNYEASLEDGGSNSHSESSDGSGRVSGHYSMSVPDGRRRKVDYTADNAGFQASVNTNEFGTKSDSPAHVSFMSSAPQVAPEGAGAPTAFKAQSAPQPSGSVDMYKASYMTQQRVEPVQSFQPSPYAFNYEADATGGRSARKESSDANGVVTGTYEVRNEDGSVRVVEYIADKDGFRANVKTNERGTKSDHPADVVINSDAPTAPLEQKYFKAPSALFAQTAMKADFPARTYTPKSSMISQKAVEPWRR